MKRLLAIATLAALGCSENRTPDQAPASDIVFDCLPDLDGALTAAELPVALERPISYLVDSDIAVELDGPSWSFEAPPARSELVQAHDLDGTWYQSEFPGAHFAVPLRPGQDSPIEGVYSLEDDGLFLHGVAARDLAEGLETVWSYRTPVALLRLPLSAGDSWTEVGEAEGLIDGSPYAATDSYEISALAAGPLEVPGAGFEPAVRVSTLVTTEPAVSGQVVTSRQDSFYFECFGELVRTISRSGENQRDYPVAELLLRIDL
ncbi:MAG: hypothetical protein KJO07_17280 [Deltaproteobacteria bacterium]|nr:hypothetical protein [Deltaproteobacteria bacterium]